MHGGSSARFPTKPTEKLKIEKIYAIKQIKICAEYRDMLPRPRLDLSGTPGLRPIGLSPGSWQTSLGLGSMSRYSAQILICITMFDVQRKEEMACNMIEYHKMLVDFGSEILKHMDIHQEKDPWCCASARPSFQSSFTVPQPLSHLIIKINVLHNICTESSNIFCSASGITFMSMGK